MKRSGVRAEGSGVSYEKDEHDCNPVMECTQRLGLGFMISLLKERKRPTVRNRPLNPDPRSLKTESWYHGIDQAS